MATYGNSAFAHAGPSTYNALPFLLFYFYIFTFLFTSKSSVFEVVTVNALYELLTYL